MTNTTQQLQAMSDFEVNKALALKCLLCEYLFNDELLTVDLISMETHLGCHGIPYDNAVKYGVFDYRNPTDIMPLAFERGICLISPASPRMKKWTASYTSGGGKWSVDEFAFADTNPLRAIACLLLMMED